MVCHLGTSTEEDANVTEEFIDSAAQCIIHCDVEEFGMCVHVQKEMTGGYPECIETWFHA